MACLYVEAKVTWYGSAVDGTKFAATNCDAVTSGRFFEERYEYHVYPIMISRQIAFDAIRRHCNYPNCAVNLKVLTEDQYDTAIAVRDKSDKELEAWLRSGAKHE